MNPVSQKIEKDYLWLQMKDMPYFRAVLRAVECQFYQDYPLEAPTLDLGCGDGHFATLAFDQTLDVGIDPWTGPVFEAANGEAIPDHPGFRRPNALSGWVFRQRGQQFRARAYPRPGRGHRGNQPGDETGRAVFVLRPKPPFFG